MSTTQSLNDEIRRDLAANRTTGKPGVLLRLLGKEAKQLAPLPLVLLACGVLLHLFGHTVDAPNKAFFHTTVLALIPVLFAVGVGPLLVSQEKELRTLRWMASLPVRPRSIVISKLIVSLLGLAACWLVSLVMTLAIYPSVLTAAGVGNAEWLFWPANTFFLLVMGFALAWILPTAGSTLVALLVTSCSAGLLAGLAHDAFGFSNTNAEFLVWIGFFYIATTVVLTVAAIRFGKNSFVATSKSQTSSAWGSKREQNALVIDRTMAPTQGPSSSLLWQIGWQNRMLWVGAALIALMGLASVGYATRFLQSVAILELAPVAGCLVLSWLGASVFGSDAHRGRIQFLADRGVPPFKIWWTRLALPLGCTFLGLIVLILMNEAWGLAQGDSRRMPSELSLPVAIGVSMAFGFAQWLPQWTRSSLIAFCISPAIAIFSFIYIGFLLTYINAPWWLLVASIGISFAATRIMLRPWMDGRTGLKYWLSQSALLATALVLPLIPFLIIFATYPSMPAALRAELNEEVKQYLPSTKGTELVMRTAGADEFIGVDGFDEMGMMDFDDSADSEEDAPRETSDKFIGFGEAISESLVDLEEQLSSIGSRPIIFSNHSMRAVIKEAQLMSLRMDAAKEESVEVLPYRERYRRSVILLSKFAIGMRKSDRLLDQEVSDQIERWIVNELLQLGRKKIFTDQEYSSMVAALADQAARHQSRRRALVLAWSKYTRGQDSSFGGMNLPSTWTESFAESWLVAERDADNATAALLEHLESKQPNPDQYSAKIQSYWQDGATEFDRKSKTIDVYLIRSPGALWHQDWETKAAKLHESLK